MKNASYWINKLGKDADKLLLNTNEIKKINQDIINEKDTSVNDITKITEDMTQAERKNYVIPEGVYEISEYAFYNNPYLRSITIPESVKTSEEHPIQNCDNLETIIFKNKSFRMFSGKDREYIGWPVGMKGLPRLQDIYLYAEDPDVFCFDLFDGLENISEVTLHVPCSCRMAYNNYEVIYYCHDKYGSLCEKKEYSFRKFKSIEEFDPIDFLEDGV